MIIIKGDLIELAEQDQFDLIIHGCNCFNTMGGGLAKSIKEKCPNAYAADKLTKYGDFAKLGNYSIGVSNNENYLIANCYTQFNFSQGEDVFDYDAFKLILRKLSNQFPTARIGIPMIGAGLAGGDWSMIVEIIKHFSGLHTGGTVTLVVFS